jgi:molybdopterin converting factor small subunit
LSDSEINLQAALEIKSLHEKVDDLTTAIGQLRDELKAKHPRRADYAQGISERSNTATRSKVRRSGHEAIEEPVPKGPTNSQRIEDLEERVAKLERRPARMAGRIISNDRLEQELKPLHDRIRAIQAVAQAYETLLVAIFQAYGIEADQIANAIRLASQKLTPDQQNIVRDLLRLV